MSRICSPARGPPSHTTLPSRSSFQRYSQNGGTGPPSRHIPIMYLARRPSRTHEREKSYSPSLSASAVIRQSMNPSASQLTSLDSFIPSRRETERTFVIIVPGESYSFSLSAAGSEAPFFLTVNDTGLFSSDAGSSRFVSCPESS